MSESLSLSSPLKLNPNPNMLSNQSSKDSGFDDGFGGIGVAPLRFEGSIEGVEEGTSESDVSSPSDPVREKSVSGKSNSVD